MNCKITINKRSVVLVSALLCIWSLPKILSMITLTNSAPIVLLVISVAYIFICYVLGVSPSWKSVIIKSFLALVVFLYLFFSSIFVYFVYGDTKPVLSIIPLFFLIFFSLVLSEQYTWLAEKKSRRVLCLIVFFLTLTGWFSVFVDIRIWNYASLSKPVFPFPEESHYALAVGPIVLAIVMSRTMIFAKILLLASTVMLSVFFPSATLMLYVMFSVLLLFYMANRKFKILAAPFLAVSLLYFLSGLDQDVWSYYLTRVVFWESSNLSALVYLQGWTDAWLGLSQNLGLGLGFQRMGTTEPSEISEKIYLMIGEYKNRADGSFLASKVIAEFGLLGVAAIGAYLRGVYKYARNPGFLEVEQNRIAYGLYLAFFIELFVRGYGYFSPGIVLVCISWMHLHRAHRVWSRVNDGLMGTGGANLLSRFTAT